MSDTSGVNLEGDMPGIGTAPPTTGIARSPIQLPTALGGLAKLFQGSQGKPNPKFLPPKPSPLTEEQARQPPQHVGSPQSIAPVPPTVPVPTGGFTPYIKTQDKRDPSQWGESTYYPRLPAAFELTGMFGQIGRYFAQAGGDVGVAADDLSRHSLEYDKGFTWAQDEKLKQAKEGMALASAQLEQSIANRLIDYRTTIVAYKNAGGYDKLLNGVSLYDALYHDAVKDNDVPAQAMFQAGLPLSQIEDYMQEADKILRDLQAAKTKASEQDDTDAGYGLKPAGGAASDWRAGGEAGAPPSPVPPGAAPPAPTPAPAPAPGDTTDQRAPGVGPPPADVPDAVKPLQSLGPQYSNPNLINAGTQIYQGVAPGAEMGKRATHDARLIADALGAETGNILADPNLKPGQYVDAVRKRLGPLPAADLQSIEDYTNPDMISGTGYGKQSEYLKQLQNIAHKDMPGDASGRGAFNAANFTLQKSFKDDNGQFQKVLVRTGDMASTLRNLHTDMDRLQKEAKKEGYGPDDIDLAGMLNSVTGKGVANRVRSDLEAYSAAYDFVVSNGHSTLGGREAFEKYFSLYLPISTLRDTLKGHVPSTMGILQGIHTHWEGIGGKKTNMPGIDAATEKEIQDYGKQDIRTGALPYDPDRPGGNDIFLKNKGPWGPAGKYYWTGNSDERDDPSNWKPVE